MQSRYRILGLCLMAVFAMSVVASATASAAAPEFIRCAKVAAGEPSSWGAGCITKKASGGYAKVSAGPGTCVKVAPGEPSSWSNATCTTAKTGTGEYIKVAAAGKLHFTGKEGVSHLYASGFTITCKEDTSKGEITGAKTVAKIGVVFTECEAENTSTKVKCKTHSPGKTETIETESLKGTLGTVAEAEAPNTEVGERLEPEGTKGFWTEEVECLTTKTFMLAGAVIGEVKPINVMQTTGELIYARATGEPTKQKIQRFVGGVKETLSWFGSSMSFESKDVITYEEPIEVT
jgi:hypothetical protein